MNRELVFLRTFAASAFKKLGNKKFSEIQMESINIVEKDVPLK